MTYYPKREYWADLLARLQRKPGFAPRLALDTYRLALATGSLTSAADYMEMAQLALQAGFAAEGQQVVDQGFAAGVLGRGPEAERQRRLRELAVQSGSRETRQAEPEAERQALAATDGSALLDLGMNLVYAGEKARGLQLMQQGLAKGGAEAPRGCPAAPGDRPPRGR